jgi:hypothetical protein
VITMSHETVVVFCLTTMNDVIVVVFVVLTINHMTFIFICCSSLCAYDESNDFYFSLS